MNQLFRRHLLRRPWLAVAGLLVLGTSLGIATAALAADAYPSKPIKILVGYSAGGAVDAIARSVGLRMSAVRASLSSSRTSRAPAPTSR
ncbi:hypothetical protein QN397_09215 [Variovorax sp. RTB1]|uniref:hypothetical protein n=1 Tax=Variovorax sp. RTB1 TaxID=3048631 RepID=UPI002B23698B|nr:hypothetical protein [Variovorax sp. RTB1]MEB0111530.1 hypothetical protein [Variovorax sp. RTB1]